MKKIELLKINIKYMYWTLKKIQSLLKVNKEKEIQEYPTTIQLPITYKCNFDCVMCGMRQLIFNPDFSAKELKEILKDKLFRNIVGVGINGGEPFLKEDLIECVQVMCENLPKLKQIFIISNGYMSFLIENKLKQIKEICIKYNVKVCLSLSVDGYKDMQDFMRGKKGAWNNVITTIDLLRKNSKLYYDEFHVVCTVTKYNVYHLPEIEVWAQQSEIDVLYNIATLNRRIANENKFEDFTLQNDLKACMVAREFFYKLAIDYRSEKYFALYLYLKDGVRYAPCPCMYNEWVTLTPDGEIAYCATHSKNLGNSLKESAYDIFNNNITYLEQLKKSKCKSCSHYIYELDKEGKKLFYDEMRRNNKF